MVRVACFKENGGFVTSLGWDFLYEVRARLAGWNTGHFDLVPFYHLKKPGAGIGTARWTLKVGEIDYLMGIAKSDLAIKILYRLGCGQPVIVEGGLLLLGYLRAWAQRKPPLVSHEEAQFYRRMRTAHIKKKLGKIFGHLLRSKRALRARSILADPQPGDSK